MGKKIINLFFTAILVISLFAGLTSPVYTYQDHDECAFSIYIFKDYEWQLQGKLFFSTYETIHLPLINDAGQLKLRIVQKGLDAASIDQVIVQKFGVTYLPTAAINVDSNADILHKILYSEYDVCNGWDSTLEIVWSGVPENATLSMLAMQQDLGEGHGAPLYYPMPYEHYTLSHMLINDGGIIVDGLLDEDTKPDFYVFWQPYSPHPDGYTYGWLHCDNDYLYAAVEVTADNTFDVEDWGALYVIVDGKRKEFHISNDQTKWGVSGFQYTSSVAYEHRIYEFKIPLREINAVAGNQIQYIFGAYGTAVTVPLIFDTVPANTGSIVFDGNVYHDGDNTPRPDIGTGPYNIKAIPASGFDFVKWQVEGNIAVNNPYSDTAQLFITGPGASTLRMVQSITPEQTMIFTGTPPSHGSSFSGTVPATQPVGLPNILTQSASLSARSVTPGTPVTVTANIVNKSAVNGNKKVTLYVNGQAETAQDVTVNSGGSTQLTFNVTRSEPGDYTVYVDGVPASSFKVELLSEPDGILIFSAALLGLAFILGMVMLWRRQRTVNNSIR